MQINFIPTNSTSIEINSVTSQSATKESVILLLYMNSVLYTVYRSGGSFPPGGESFQSLIGMSDRGVTPVRESLVTLTPVPAISQSYLLAHAYAATNVR